MRGELFMNKKTLVTGACVYALYTGLIFILLAVFGAAGVTIHSISQAGKSMGVIEFLGTVSSITFKVALVSFICSFVIHISVALLYSVNPAMWDMIHDKKFLVPIPDVKQMVIYYDTMGSKVQETYRGGSHDRRKSKESSMSTTPEKKD